MCRNRRPGRIYNCLWREGKHARVIAEKGCLAWTWISSPMALPYQLLFWSLKWWRHNWESRRPVNLNVNSILLNVYFLHKVLFDEMLYLVNAIILCKLTYTVVSISAKWQNSAKWRFDEMLIPVKVSIWCKLPTCTVVSISTKWQNSRNSEKWRFDEMLYLVNATILCKWLAQLLVSRQNDKIQKIYILTRCWILLMCQFNANWRLAQLLVSRQNDKFRKKKFWSCISSM